MPIASDLSALLLLGLGDPVLTTVFGGWFLVAGGKLNSLFGGAVFAECLQPRFLWKFEDGVGNNTGIFLVGSMQNSQNTIQHKVFWKKS